MEKQIKEIVYAQPVEGEITRNAKGDYQWNAKVRGSNPEEVFGMLIRFDDLMKVRYGPKPMANLGKDEKEA